MLKTIVDSISLLDVDSQHTVNEVESWIAHRVPIWRGVVESSCLDLLGEGVRVLLGVKLVREGWKAAKTNVEDNS
jgi:hypothetical protein